VSIEEERLSPFYQKVIIVLVVKFSFPKVGRFSWVGLPPTIYYYDIKNHIVFVLILQWLKVAAHKKGRA
jgi:CubicO group peptidase (beta-lactamase class C family)